MTSPTLSQPRPKAPAREQTGIQRYGIPLILFFVTMLSTTTVGMRYMHNFLLGQPLLTTDADILPYAWVLHHLRDLATGLPFSITLITILLVHEFGHFFACRAFEVRSTLPYLLPAPSLSGTFGAVIRLRSAVRSRTALIVIGASGPIAGFVVALAAVAIGLAHSTYTASPVVHSVQAPLAISIIHGLMGPAPAIELLVPHPILIASWIGLLITALNLIPAGQLDGGHILYAISPGFHRWFSRIVVAILFVLGVFYWAGWILWGIILLLPGMRHPKVPDNTPIKRSHYALIPICGVILLLTGTFQPFEGYGLLDIIPRIAHHK